MLTILASASPRRRELMEQMGVEFIIRPARGEEVVTKTVPEEVVQELAYQKAKEIALQRMKEKEQLLAAKREKKALKLEKRKKKKKSKANVSFDDEQYTSKERQEQLRKAKEWRKAMKLEI